MDLKRAWRNGFLVSLIFALPLSDLYYFQHDNNNVNGSSGNDSIDRRKLTGDGNVEGNELAIPEESSADALLASNDIKAVNFRDAALHFSTQDILQYVDLTGEDNPVISDDVKQIVDTDIGSIASLSFDFGDSMAYVPGHSGPYAPAMFSAGRNAGFANGFHAGLEDVTETPFVEQLPESSEQTETIIPNDNPNIDTSSDGGDTLHTVPEPSSLLLMSIGTISMVSLLHRRNSKSPATHSSDDQC